ncbi:acyl-CoA synthetase (AMP-forming)/AMP-acid ligase II [Spongiibacter sp. IMCC21906]|jgi:acyl-CoA synthetase (AMP-forming)/AMP-acid ligase II|uniref:long-chain-fatty-acid--CoA ligase n=1 Tax=Spongiibacter sp. IMCC21906 TaxID=1620392 RepID=UPI00062DD45E|nr:long-chain-fatty-acid--CoA ligase [Spongiibacter sp. IMCC21906]AKH69058.1 acyl-CoA synthetase (AMP-forming)/AMP-acid ligase II [Spongiibacter sp. IMCC21906]
MWAYPEIRNVADIVRFNAKNYSDKTATQFAGRALSWQQMDDMSSKMANALSASGVGVGDRVLYYAGNADDYFLTIYACAKINAVFVPMNWRMVAAEIATIVADADPAIALVEDTFKSVWEGACQELGRDIPTVDIELGKGDDNPLWQWYANAESTDPNVFCPLDSTAWQIYTSGTTGVPKGVQMTHGGIMNQRLCEHLEPAYTWGPEDRYLFCVPSFHLLGLGLSMQAMYNGASIIVAPRFDPSEVLTLINDYKPTLAGLAPVMIQMLLENPNTDNTDFSCIREIMYAGSPISMGLLKQAMERIPCKFMQFYGSTESGGAITLLRPDDHDLNNEKRLTSCGKPLPLMEIRIVDAEGNILGANEPGEMLIKLPSITKGYWKKPDAWAEVYENGWYRSGDVGYFDDNGYYYLVDRAKDMIVSGGENIYSSEVENCLSLHPEVAAVAIIGVPSEKWGEEVKAFVVPKAGCTPAAEELINFSKQKLAPYKCPKSVEFVDDFPRTGAGKVSKKDLRAPYWVGVERGIG